MSRVSLIQLNPRRAADGVVQVQYWSHNARTKCRFLGLDWLPGVVSLPETELDLGFDGAKFGQGATPTVGQLRIAIGKTDAWAGLVWKGAAGSLRTAAWPAGFADPDDAAFAVELSFRVESISIDDGVATLTLIDLGADLRRPLITRKFGSTGNALLDGAGVVDMQGRVVPTGWGRLRSVPGILVDRVNNVWLLLDRPSSSIQGFFDGGAAFTMGMARASLAELQGAAPAAGAVDYCLNASGLTLARPWTAPTYPFTADLTATGNQTAGAIAQSVVATRSTLGFSAGTIAAFDALYPTTCGLYVDDERTIATALDELFVRLGGFWRLTGPGEIMIGRLAPAAPVKTFGQTAVASIARQSIVMPTRRRSVGYGRNNRVHNEGEIATILLVDDIAGLGDLATQDWVDWSGQVVGAGKPQDDATRNVNRNAWVSAALGTAFVVGDEVLDQGSSWVCIAAHAKTALNGPPALPTASNATWGLRSAKGDVGDPGLPAFVVTLSRPTVTIACSSAGAPLAGELAKASGQVKATYGGVDVTGSCTFAKIAESSLMSGAITSGGAYSLSSIGAVDSGSITYRCTYDPPSADPAVFTDIDFIVAKGQRGAAAIRARDTMLSVPTPTMAPISDTLLMPVANGTVISISAYAGYIGSGGSGATRSVDVRLKAAWRYVGGSSWTDVSSYSPGAPASQWNNVDGAWEGGLTVYAQTIGGFTTDDVIEIRLEAQYTASGGSPTISAPSFSGEFVAERTT